MQFASGVNFGIEDSHILVPTEEQALSIKAQLQSGELLFDEAAMRFSTCNSASQGGKLGKFNPGTMVPEFDVRSRPFLASPPPAFYTWPMI